METKPKALRRRLFGVRSEDVQQLLADRDATAVAAGEQIRAAEDRAKAFQARAASLEAQLAEVTQEQTRPNDGPDSTDPHLLLLAVREEMARVMHATKEAGSRIIDLARVDVEHQLDDVERRRNEVDGERERLDAWVDELQESAGGLRESIVDAAGFIHRTLSAMQDAERAMARVVGQMAQTDAVLQRLRESPDEPGQQASSESVRAPAQVVGSLAANGNGNSNGNGYGAPEPPVDVTPGATGLSSQEGGPSSQAPPADPVVRPEGSFDGDGDDTQPPDRALAAS